MENDSAPYYPPLDEATVKNLDLVRQLSLEHKAYWLNSEYPPAIEKLVKAWFDPQTMKDMVVAARKKDDAEANKVSIDEDRYEYLYQEAMMLYKEMKNAKYAGSNEDSMAYFKTAVSLQEKLIGLQERALGMKQVSEYHAMILGIMENVMSEEQRTKFMDQLKHALGQ